MRRTIKIPRILKINWINEFKISVVYNNGESRVIDFKKVFKKLRINEESPAYILLDKQEFRKAKVEGNTLSWNNVDQFITAKNGGKTKVPYEIGADVLLEYSEPEKPIISSKIGHIIRENRLKSGLTQLDLAIKSGTSRAYISRIENNHSDMELATLKKIVETGLGKHLEIKIK